MCDLAPRGGLGGLVVARLAQPAADVVHQRLAPPRPEQRHRRVEVARASQPDRPIRRVHLRRDRRRQLAQALLLLRRLFRHDEQRRLRPAHLPHPLLIRLEVVLVAGEKEPALAGLDVPQLGEQVPEKDDRLKVFLVLTVVRDHRLGRPEGDKADHAEHEQGGCVTGGNGGRQRPAAHRRPDRPRVRACAQSAGAEDEERQGGVERHRREARHRVEAEDGVHITGNGQQRHRRGAKEQQCRRPAAAGGLPVEHGQPRPGQKKAQGRVGGDPVAVELRTEQGRVDTALPPDAQFDEFQCADGRHDHGEPPCQPRLPSDRLRRPH